MPDSPYAWDAEYDFKPIWRFKPADRFAEVRRQLSDAAYHSDAEDPETGNPIIEVMWVVSRFDTEPSVRRFVSHGHSRALDGNSKSGIVLSDVGDDANVELLTIAEHVIGRISPVKAS